MENIEGGHLEKEPEYKVEIRWDPEGKIQKFVDFEDENGNYYIYSCPMSVFSQHRDIIVEGAKFFGVSGKITKKGGGSINKNEAGIFVGGSSVMIGDFDKEKARIAFEREFTGEKVFVA